MGLKNEFLDNISEFLDKLDDDIAEIYEKMYKSEVAINTIISLMIKKGIITKEEFAEEMGDVRKRVKTVITTS